MLSSHIIKSFVVMSSAFLDACLQDFYVHLQYNSERIFIYIENYNSSMFLSVLHELTLQKKISLILFSSHLNSTCFYKHYMFQMLADCHRLRVQHAADSTFTMKP